MKKYTTVAHYIIILSCVHSCTNCVTPRKACSSYYERRYAAKNYCGLFNPKITSSTLVKAVVGYYQFFLQQSFFQHLVKSLSSSLDFYDNSNNIDVNNKTMNNNPQKTTTQNTFNIAQISCLHDSNRKYKLVHQFNKQYKQCHEEPGYCLL